MVLKLLKLLHLYVKIPKCFNIKKEKHFSQFPPNFQTCDNQTPPDGFRREPPLKSATASVSFLGRDKVTCWNCLKKRVFMKPDLASLRLWKVLSLCFGVFVGFSLAEKQECKWLVARKRRRERTLVWNSLEWL